MVFCFICESESSIFQEPGQVLEFLDLAYNWHVDVVNKKAFCNIYEAGNVCNYAWYPKIQGSLVEQR